jgi:Ca2+-binding RTX toxin-like protein
MPQVTFGTGAGSSPVDLINWFDGVGSVPLVQVSADELVFTDGTTTFLVTGANFSGTVGAVTGGTVTGVQVLVSGVVQTTITGLSLEATQLQQTVFLDAVGADDAAVENVFLGLGYRYIGNGSDDILLSTSTSSEGVVLNFSGNDRFDTRGGRDNIWMGDGNDTGLGGAGGDTLEGGQGDDRLQGDFGGDRLFGDDGSDSLDGGASRDRLYGGLGADTLDGGTDDDRLGGAGGRDVFVFAVGDGDDTVSGFNARQDQIDIADGVPFQFVITEGSPDLVIAYGAGGDTITLLNVSSDDIPLIFID